MSEFIYLLDLVIQCVTLNPVIGEFRILWFFATNGEHKKENPDDTKYPTFMWAE
jgi:hypothetical protein